MARRAWPYTPSRALRLASDERSRNGSGVELVAPHFVYVSDTVARREEKNRSKVRGLVCTWPANWRGLYNINETSHTHAYNTG